MPGKHHVMGNALSSAPGENPQHIHLVQVEEIETHAHLNVDILPAIERWLQEMSVLVQGLFHILTN